MPKKQETLLKTLADMCPVSSRKSWWHKLKPEQLEELYAVREAFLAGTLVLPKSRIREAVCKKFGIKVPLSTFRAFFDSVADDNGADDGKKAD